MAPGVALIGDAAEHNDPTIGQGCAIAFRDVWLVGELLAESDDWGNEAIFEPYAEERRERMRAAPRDGPAVLESTAANMARSPRASPAGG